MQHHHRHNGTQSRQSASAMAYSHPQQPQAGAVDLSEFLESWADMIRPPPQVLEERRLLTGFLHNLLVSECPGARWEIYGSCRSTLDMAQSDLDLGFVLPSEQQPPPPPPGLPMSPANSLTAGDDSSGGGSGIEGSAPDSPLSSGSISGSQDSELRSSSADSSSSSSSSSSSTSSSPPMGGTELLFRLYNRLRMEPGFHVQLISAAVPIVKLKQLGPPGLDLDLSHLKQEALDNALFLRRFLALDDRVRPLLMAVRHWAKNRNLCDAFMQTLNSFGWSLLVVSFLQSCEPPVLPAMAYHSSEPAVSPGLSPVSLDSPSELGFLSPNPFSDPSPVSAAGGLSVDTELELHQPMELETPKKRVRLDSGNFSTPLSSPKMSWASVAARGMAGGPSGRVLRSGTKRKLEDLVKDDDLDGNAEGNGGVCVPMDTSCTPVKPRDSEMKSPPSGKPAAERWYDDVSGVRRQWCSENRQTMHELLVEFFALFAGRKVYRTTTGTQLLFVPQNAMIDVLGGHICPRSELSHPALQWAVLCILDPAYPRAPEGLSPAQLAEWPEPSNVAKSVTLETWSLILQELSRAHSLLKACLTGGSRRRPQPPHRIWAEVCRPLDSWGMGGGAEFTGQGYIGMPVQGYPPPPQAMFGMAPPPPHMAGMHGPPHMTQMMVPAVMPGGMHPQHHRPPPHMHPQAHLISMQQQQQQQHQHQSLQHQQSQLPPPHPQQQYHPQQQQQQPLPPHLLQNPNNHHQQLPTNSGGGGGYTGVVQFGHPPNRPQSQSHPQQPLNGPPAHGPPRSHQSQLLSSGESALESDLPGLARSASDRILSAAPSQQLPHLQRQNSQPLARIDHPTMMNRQPAAAAASSSGGGGLELPKAPPRSIAEEQDENDQQHSAVAGRPKRRSRPHRSGSRSRASAASSSSSSSSSDAVVR